MFTGIIECVGKVSNLQQLGKQWQLTIAVGELDMSDVSLGDSIAVNGACLTVVAMNNKSFQADMSNETMQLTTLGLLARGAEVNLEKALSVAGRLGGHIVSGHVDGVGVVESVEVDGNSTVLIVKAPDALARYIATKGSICIDGTSLTVNKVNGAKFTVTIIPHTQQETVIKHYLSSSKVNIEVDLIARYLERLLLGDAAAVEIGQCPDTLTRELLHRHGFVGGKF